MVVCALLGTLRPLSVCSAVTDIEYTAIKMLIEAEEKLRSEGIAVWLAAHNPQALAIVHRSKLGETLGNERMLFNLEVAVEKYERIRPSAATESTVAR